MCTSKRVLSHTDPHGYLMSSPKETLDKFPQNLWLHPALLTWPASLNLSLPGAGLPFPQLLILYHSSHSGSWFPCAVLSWLLKSSLPHSPPLSLPAAHGPAYSAGHVQSGLYQMPLPCSPSPVSLPRVYNKTSSSTLPRCSHTLVIIYLSLSRDS